MCLCSNSLFALFTSVKQDIAEAGDKAHRKYEEEN